MKIKIIFLLVLFMSSCTRQSSLTLKKENIGQEVKSPKEIKLEVVTKKLNFPWAFAFLPSGNILVTERPGFLRMVDSKGQISNEISGLPQVYFNGQGGLLDVILDPKFSQNHMIYFSYAESNGNESGTAVASAQLNEQDLKLTNLKVIFRQFPKVESGVHFGSRLAFDLDENLFITLGDRLLDGDRPGSRKESQNLSNHLGKIIRIKKDGSIPSENPFVNMLGLKPEIWSMGHRNVQGAAIHPDTGELWIAEHGPLGGDELNISLKGKNYGWPLVSYGCNYGDNPGNCRPVGGMNSAQGLEEPLDIWVPLSTAPSGMTFYNSDGQIEDWRGNLFVSALAGAGVWRMVLDGNKVVSREKLFSELNSRIRDVRQSPDGDLYFITDDSNGILYKVEYK